VCILQAIRDRLSRADALLRYVLIGDCSRYRSFCDALEKAGRSEALKYVLYVKPECSSSVDEMVPVVAAQPAVPRKDAYKLLCEDYVINLRKNYCDFYERLDAESDFLAQLRASPDGFTWETVMTFEVCKLVL